MDGEIVGISKNARYLFDNQLTGILEMPTNFTKSTHLIHYRFMIDGVRIMISDFPKKKRPFANNIAKGFTNFIEVGSGFEPPYEVLQTSA